MNETTDLVVAVPASYEAVTALVLDSVSSPLTRRVYATALSTFLGWWDAQGRPPLTRAVVQAYKADLESQGARPGKLSQHLAALRRLAREAAANGYISWEIATGIAGVAGPRERGSRIGNWLSQEQTQKLISSPDKQTLKGRRDRAMLGLLVGCGLRRSEVAMLTLAHLQLREARWVIVDLRGKHGRIRSIAVPSWVKALVDDWTTAAGLTSGRLMRSIDRHGNIGQSISPQAVLDVVVTYSQEAVGVGIRPHDLRRTCARLCRSAGGELEQIQALLGHASLTTTEAYLGSTQDLQRAPNDAIRIRI